MKETADSPRPIHELVRYFLRLGLLGFGGPVALVGQMERALVGEKKWLTKDEMREGIAVCQSLPGPLAIQVGIWISYIRGVPEDACARFHALDALLSESRLRVLAKALSG